MELQREYVEDASGLRATITTIPQIDKSVEEPIVGKIRIESVEGEEIDGVRGEELPDIIRIRQPKGDYIKINDKNSTVKKGDGLPEEFNLKLDSSESADIKSGTVTIQTGDRVGDERKIKIKVTSSQVVNIAGKIISDGLNEDILNDIKSYYNVTNPAEGEFRDDVRNYVDFYGYYQILNDLYEVDSDKEEISEDLINSFAKHVIAEGSEYHPESESEFNEMLEFYLGLENLPEFTENNISEFKGFINENFAKQAALSGDFDSAEDYLSTAIRHFEDAGRPEVKEPTAIKQIALEGLIKESKGKFKEAKQDYEAAADELEAVDRINDGDAEVYEVWAQLAEVKHNLANGDYETARDICKSISGGYEAFNLVDLRKLNILVELLEDLENDRTSNGNQIFRKAEMPGTFTPDKTTREYELSPKSDRKIARDLIVQYETDYSSAYSVLLSKQQLKKLGRDSIDDESLRSAIVDGITPLGNGSSPSKKSNNDTDNMMGVSAKESSTSSGLSKTKERSQDRTFDALDEDNDETITYESQVSDTQKGRYHHEEAIDTFENYLKKHGFNGGETNWSDFIATDGDNVLLVEAKHITPDTEATQIRSAVGQLLEYRYRDILQDDEFSELNLTLWLLLAQPPSDTFKQILDSFRDKGIYTLWIHNYEISGLEESLTKLEQITSE